MLTFQTHHKVPQQCIYFYHNFFLKVMFFSEKNRWLVLVVWGQAVAQLAEALRCKPKDR